MERPGSFSRLSLISVSLFLGLSCSVFLGQSEVETRTQAKEADEELNSTYRQLMSALPPRSREQLRVAERAWLDFTALNSAALRATGQRRGLSLVAAEQWQVLEVRARSRQLREMSSKNVNVSDGTVGSYFRKADADLNAVYQQCLAVLSPPEVAQLRQAQRAWLTFRTASGSFAQKIPLMITTDRTWQLNGFYLQTNRRGVGQSQTAPTPSIEEEKIDPTIPDPYERVRK